MFHTSDVNDGSFIIMRTPSGISSLHQVCGTNVTGTDAQITFHAISTIRKLVGVTKRQMTTIHFIVYFLCAHKKVTICQDLTKQ